MAGKSTPVLLVTANVGSIFEDVCTTDFLNLFEVELYFKLCNFCNEFY